jgi:hypothetical protein
MAKLVTFIMLALQINVILEFLWLAALTDIIVTSVVDLLLQKSRGQVIVCGLINGMNLKKETKSFLDPCLPPICYPVSVLFY